MIKAGVYSYVHSILSSSRSLAIRGRFTPSSPFPPTTLFHPPLVGASVIVWARFSRAICILPACGVPATGHRNTIRLSFLLSLPFTPLLPLPASYRPVRQGRERVFPRILSDKNFNTTRAIPRALGSSPIGIARSRNRRIFRAKTRGITIFALLTDSKCVFCVTEVHI